MVAFATKVPGQIKPLDLDGTKQYMVHRGGYLCGVPSVVLEIGFQQKLSAGFFGGEGFILQRVSGTGAAWIELDGEVIEYDLPPGEVLKVHPGHVGLFDASVSFEIERVKGIKNMLFGADALFLAKLTGPRRASTCRPCPSRTSQPRSRSTCPATPTAAVVGATRSRSAGSSSAAERPAGSVAVVVADGFEHEAERVEPERREVRRRVLRELLRRRTALRSRRRRRGRARRAPRCGSEP